MTVERLNLALLVDRQHHGMRRRIDIEADNIANLLGEFRVRGQLEGPHAVRLKAVAAPDALHRADANPAHLGHHGARPVGDLARRIGKRQGNHTFRHIARKRWDAGGARLIPQQAVRTALHEPLLPTPDGSLCYAAARMISAVPWPSPVMSTICARQTCFCGLLRSDTTASKPSRSAGVTSTVIPVRIPRFAWRAASRKAYRTLPSGFIH